MLWGWDEYYRLTNVWGSERLGDFPRPRNCTMAKQRYKARAVLIPKFISNLFFPMIWIDYTWKYNQIENAEATKGCKSLFSTRTNDVFFLEATSVSNFLHFFSEMFYAYRSNMNMYSWFPKTQILKCCILLWLCYRERLAEFTTLFPIFSLTCPRRAFDLTSPPKLLSSRSQPLPSQIQWLGLSPHFIQFSRTQFVPPSSFRHPLYLASRACLPHWLPRLHFWLFSFLTSKCWGPPHSVLSPCVFSVPKWSLPTTVSLALNLSLSSRREYQLHVQHGTLDV